MLIKLEIIEFLKGFLENFLHLKYQLIYLILQI